MWMTTKWAKRLEQDLALMSEKFDTIESEFLQIDAKVKAVIYGRGDAYLTPRQVSRLYGISYSNLHRLRKSTAGPQELPFMKIRRRIYYKDADVKVYLATKRNRN